MRFGSQIPQGTHAIEDVQLTRPRALGIDHRIECRRRFRQSGEHRRLGGAYLLERFAEVDLRRRRKTVSALPQEYLVDIDLEDLVLAERRFDLERKQGFVKLANVGLFTRDEEIARHLHRDGRRALLLSGAGHIRNRGAQDAKGIDATVLIKAVIFRRQDRLFHHHRHVVKANDIAPFFAELPDEESFGAEYSQWNLRLIVRQGVDRWQARISPSDGKRNDQQTDGERCENQSENPLYPADGHD